MDTVKNTGGKRCVTSQSRAEGIEIYSGMLYVQSRRLPYIFKNVPRRLWTLNVSSFVYLFLLGACQLHCLKTINTIYHSEKKKKNKKKFKMSISLSRFVVNLNNSYRWLGPSGLRWITVVNMFAAHYKVRRDFSDTCRVDVVGSQPSVAIAHVLNKNAVSWQTWNNRKLPKHKLSQNAKNLQCLLKFGHS